MFSFRQWARQRRYPPEFRIPELQDQPATAARETEPSPESESPAQSDLDDRTVAYVATNMWRVLKRFSDNGDGEVPKAQRMAMKNLTAMSDRLSDAGVCVEDPVGIPWDPGLLLKVIAYEPRPNLERETVVETVQPTVKRGERCIQIGHVIVGVPEKGQDSGAGDH